MEYRNFWWASFSFVHFNGVDCEKMSSIVWFLLFKSNFINFSVHIALCCLNLKKNWWILEEKNKKNGGTIKWNRRNNNISTDFTASKINYFFSFVGNNQVYFWLLYRFWQRSQKIWSFLIWVNLLPSHLL